MNLKTKAELLVLSDRALLAELMRAAAAILPSVPLLGEQAVEVQRLRNAVEASSYRVPSEPKDVSTR